MQELPGIPFYQLSADNFIIVVIVDDLTHTDASPFCPDMACPCHTDEALLREYIFLPWEKGLLSPDEAIRLHAGAQLVPPPMTVARITDEEIEAIMNEPSPLDEDYRRSFFDGLDPDDLEDHPF